MARIFQSFCTTLAMAALGACASLPESEGMTRAASVAAGSSFVRSIQNSGSYGTGTSTTTVTRAPNREWKGQTVGVWQQTAGPTLLFHPANGGFVAFVNGDQPVISFDPTLDWPWPLKVGKSWTRKTTMTIHGSDQRVPVELNSVVEAYEDVSMPAGTFKAYRVRTVDSLGNEDVNWFSTDLTVFLKQKLTRTVRHAAGPGVRETELLTQAIRHH
jgi:hypothetical protein